MADNGLRDQAMVPALKQSPRGVRSTRGHGEKRMTATLAPSVAPLDTAALESVFRALLADMSVDPRRLLDGAALVPTVERTATPGLFLVPSATTPDAAYRVQNGLCNCLDAQRRDARRCKHALSVACFQMLERRELEVGDP